MAPAARLATSSAMLLFASTIAAQAITPAPSTTGAATSPSITAVSDCHAHGTVQYCVAGTEEYQVVGPTRTEEFESQYTGCHLHGSETMCMDSKGEEVTILVESHEEPADEEHDDDHGHDHGEESESGEVACHFHAGVEHCTGPGEEEESTGKQQCERRDREYNVPLRVGLLFVILATGTFGVFMPILASKFTRMSQKSIFFVILKQFGTGVVLSTAFIHLFTHAELTFANDCLGPLAYESTTAAIFLAGFFLSFLVDYLGARIIMWRQNKKAIHDAEGHTTPTSADAKGEATPDSGVARADEDDRSSHVHVHGNNEEKVGVWVLEAGVIFHSLLIGLTLVVAGDSFFLTLFAVIIFHQMFEGIALGTCIAGLPAQSASFLQKCMMAVAFGLITPLGMAIGIGVLDRFNGNDPSTLVAIGTLDAFSAGILAWVGIVEMLARDWLHGPLHSSSPLRTIVAMVSLIAGLALMSLLGKWT
ncbi:Zip-domain-containing protein [Westerdykella ornata]|uniref:Zip-domain-containing protein n=1 Tax=Westerdykella ornata TaxID=318751 RepID=A0A6A6JU94_WESOR|nr:Zip-domain-containing protein [Westerdykella ornata]KAF2279794.1 Zip-domain-containing protein [Westerdykella ornata]